LTDVLGHPVNYNILNTDHQNCSFFSKGNFSGSDLVLQKFISNKHASVNIYIYTILALVP